MAHRESISPKREYVLANQTIRHAMDVLGFLRSNPMAGTETSRRRVRVAHEWLLRFGNNERARAQARLEAAAFPPHHALWICIHGGEAGSWANADTGGNGHYGGLQMHPGWGYGTSYYASADSQIVQEWAAERGYRASGYSRAWLIGQWGETIGPCWHDAY